MELSPRLKSVYSLLPADCVMIDVGTDHCHLPIYALQQGRIRRAFASDVRPGPLQNGQSNAALYGVADRITTLLSDGLDALSEAQRRQIDTVVCAGMGGTLIQSIIAAAPFLKDSQKTLILQPQKAVYELKEYLAREGFAITAEKLSREGDKIYQCMSVRYSGAPLPVPDPFALLQKDALFAEYAAVERRRLQRQKKGLEQGGISEQARYDTVCQHLKQLEDAICESTGNL